MNNSSSREIRVMVVDDSAVLRALICDSVTNTPGMMVAGTASNGLQALEIFDSVRPDVVTLDVQMPKMDGLATLSALLEKRPVPVIMVSSMTKLGAQITLDAMERGAIDYVAKPDYGAQTRIAIQEELPRKIRIASGVDVRRIVEIRRQKKERRAEPASPFHAVPDKNNVMPTAELSETELSELSEKCVAIGISTGGPPALARVFEKLRPPMPPIVVVQHMPPKFTESLAWRLDSLSALSVKEAAEGDVLRPNQAVIAPGGKHLKLRKIGPQVRVVISDEESVSGHKPSVDVMMGCAAKIFGGGCLGVVMTGMGRDGSDGCRAVREAGGYTLGQDETSSDVYGMNKVAFVEGNVDRQFALSEGAAIIMREIQRLAPAKPVGATS